MKTRQLSPLQVKILLNRGWLTTQPTNFANAVIAVTQLREFQPGQTIFFEGDETDGLDGIVSGSAGIYSAPTNNPPVLIHVAGPGEWGGGGRCPFQKKTQEFPLRWHVLTLQSLTSAGNL